MQNNIENSNKSAPGSSKTEMVNQKWNRMHILGRLGVVALKTMQASAQLCFIPAVKAAAPANEAPKKPPPMKYQDLSMYDCPHFKYKEFIADKDNCPNQDVKLLQAMLLPSVKEYRKDIASTFQDIKHEMVDTYNEITGDYRSAEKQFLTYMRDPENKSVSLVFMGTAALVGLRLGRTMPRRLFAAGLALFVSGSICFPEETDEAARTVMYHVGKAFVPLYNFYFGTDWELRERVPCARDLPEIPTPPIKPFPACGKK